MKMIKAYIRPQKEREVLNALNEKGIAGATFKSILGRGKERGLKAGNMYYNEIAKSMLVIVAEDDKEDLIKSTIVSVCKSGKTGAFGDGKIFTIPLEKVVTISTGEISK